MPVYEDASVRIGSSNVVDGDFIVDNSIVLDGTADYLERTFSSSPDSNQILTLSYWIKRSRDGADGILGTTTAHYDRINHGGELGGSQVALTFNALSTTGQVGPDALGREDRDYGAWMHVVVAIDTTQGTSTNRCKFYINGVQKTTAESTAITLNETFGFLNNSTATFVGKSHDSSQYAKCYLAEVIVIDGTQLDASSFGEYDTNGNWIPKDPTGLNFGKNGFYLPFKNASQLGDDYTPITYTAPVNNYKIDNSIWTDSGDYLSTSSPGAGSSDQVMTVGGWYKVTSDADDVALFCWTRTTNTNDYVRLGINSDGTIRFVLQNTADVTRMDWATTRKMVDPTAWFHVVATVSTDGQAIARLWFNGVEETDFTKTTDNLTSGDQFRFGNSSHNHSLFSDPNGSDNQGAIYAAQVFYQDGQECTDISNYGSYDANGIWQPVDLSGLTYGTNGYLLEFATAPGTGAGSGDDTSGNANDLTENSMTAAQQVADTPTDDAANNVGNYATLNPLDHEQGDSTLSNGNLTLVGNGNHSSVKSTQVTDGSSKYTFEVTVNAHDTNIAFGFMEDNDTTSAGNKIGGQVDSGWAVVTDTGSGNESKYDGSSMVTGMSTMANGDKYHIEFDNSTGDVFVWLDSGGGYAPENSGATVVTGSGKTALAGARVHFACHVYQTSGTNSLTVNFGEGGSWDKTPTVGYDNPLATYTAPAPTVTDPTQYFSTGLYEGAGLTRSVRTCYDSTGTAWTPDLVWIKNRDVNDKHQLYDVLRGPNDALHTNTTVAANTQTENLKSFVSGGFTLGTNDEVNTAAESYVAWQWKAGGAGVSNSDGTVTTTLSVADHGGFSIGTFTSTGDTQTFGHGLSGTPGMIIVKNTTTAGSWIVYHDKMNASPETGYLLLNSTNVFTTDSTQWNDTAPTPSVFTGSSGGVNPVGSDTMVFYAFARIPGLIGIGSYTGNLNADGPYVVVDDGASGFRPAFLLIKRIGGTTTNASWYMYDAARSPYNEIGLKLTADGVGDEAAFNGANEIDFTANGFKLRSATANSGTNLSGETHIYLAFADYPFKESRAR